MPNHSKGRSRNDVLIDPYGIYGTRTAARLRNMRRRQQAQQIILALIIVVLVAAGIYSWRTRRIPQFHSDASWSIYISPSATPAWDSQYQQLLTPTRDGQIVATWPLARPVRSRILLETDFPIHSTPVLDEKYFYTGSENGVLYALDRETGKLIWQYNSGTSISTQPQILGNLIFGGNDDGWLFCLRTKNGELVWRRKLPSAIGDGLATVSTPTKLVLAPLTDGAAQRGGVWALDANNGTIKWKFPAQGVTDAQQITPPVTVDMDGGHRAFCANDTGALVNLNAVNGKYGDGNSGWKIYWKNEKKPTSALLLRHSPLINLSASPKYLYINGNDDVVRCVDIKSGNLVWKWKSPAIVTGKLQLAQGQLLVPCRGAVSYLLDSNTGELTATLAGNNSSFVSMVRIEKEIWSLDGNGTLSRYPLSK